VVDHPAGRLARVVPALESGNGDRRGEFADVVELDDSPPPIGCRPSQTTWSASLVGLPAARVIQVAASDKHLEATLQVRASAIVTGTLDYPIRGINALRARGRGT